MSNYMVKYGVAALACYSAHAVFHLINGRPEDLLWVCHLGAAFIGVGLLLASRSRARKRRPTAEESAASDRGLPSDDRSQPGTVFNGIGTLFLCVGTPLWVMDLAGGGVLYPTSLLTHFGGLAIGLYGVRRIGMPRGVWWKAVGAMIGLILICRLVTPARANVNVAFAVYASAAKVFSSHLIYLATMLSAAAGYFFVIEYVLRRWVSPARTLETGMTEKEKHEGVDRRAKPAS